MRRLAGYVFALLLAGVYLVGCAAPEPIPSPHATALVHPPAAGGKAFLFVANRFTDQVFRIDLSNYDLKAVTVGNKPRNIAARPDGGQIAVASEKDKSITLINTVSLRKLKIRTGREPRDVQYSPNGAWVAVANYKNESVSLIDTSTGAQSEVWVGGGPISVAFDETSRIVAVACYHEEAIRVISVAAKQVIRSWSISEIEGLDLYGEPQVLAFGPADTPAAQMLFVGMRTDDYVTSESYAKGLAVIPAWVEDDALQIGTAYSVTIGPNPRGILFDHGGERALVLNHAFGQDLGYDTDTISVVSRGREETPPVADLPGDADPADPDASAWREDWRFVVESNPIAAALHPTANVLAVACREGNVVELLHLDNLTSMTVEVDKRPFALSFTAAGHAVLVAHETPLMPLTLVNPHNGDTKTIKQSLSMDRWVE